MTTFGQKLKEYRLSKGLSQAALAKIINFSQSILCDWENGKSEPTASAIATVANYFQCSVDELLGREDYGTGNVVIQGAQLSAFDERLLQVVHMLTLEDQYQVLGFAQALAK